MKKSKLVLYSLMNIKMDSFLALFGEFYLSSTIIDKIKLDKRCINMANKLEEYEAYDYKYDYLYHIFDICIKNSLNIFLHLDVHKSECHLIKHIHVITHGYPFLIKFTNIVIFNYRNKIIVCEEYYKPFKYSIKPKVYIHISSNISNLINTGHLSEHMKDDELFELKKDSQKSIFFNQCLNFSDIIIETRS
jgi:hypothetical protein